MSILYPMILMVLITLAYGPYLLRVRINAVKRGDLKASYFRLFKEEKTGVPEQVIKAKHHFTTLFETPVLFYVAALTILVTHIDNGLYAILGYGYVVARLAHGWVHLTHNRVQARLRAFMASYLILVIIWLLILWDTAFLPPTMIGQH